MTYVSSMLLLLDGKLHDLSAVKIRGILIGFAA